jgi:peptidoglycan/LPS O-acetylase OafA/YrhL
MQQNPKSRKRYVPLFLTIIALITAAPLAYAHGGISDDAAFAFIGGLIGLGLGSTAAIMCLAMLKMHWLARLGAAFLAFMLIVPVCVFAGLAVYHVAKKPKQSLVDPAVIYAQARVSRSHVSIVFIGDQAEFNQR